MARSIPERRKRAPLLLTVLLYLPLVHAATNTPAIDHDTMLDVQGRNSRLDVKAGTLQLSDVTLRQGPSTLIRAAEASGTGVTDTSDHSHWELTGSVHIEFNDAILDADSATIEFADNQLKEIHVKGTPAHFSHQLKGAPQRSQGRALNIDYDAQSTVVKMSGSSWYSDGRNEINTQTINYDMGKGQVDNATGGDQDQFHMTINPNKRIPPPRTPDRATAP